MFFNSTCSADFSSLRSLKLAVIILKTSPLALLKREATITTCLIFSINSGAAPSCIMILISRFFTLAIDGSFSVVVRETTLSSTGVFIGVSNSLFISGCLLSAVKSKPGIGRPTPPLVGASVSAKTFSASFNDLIVPLGEKVVWFSTALLISKSTLTSTTYLRLSITFSNASFIRFLRLFSSISF